MAEMQLNITRNHVSLVVRSSSDVALLNKFGEKILSSPQRVDGFLKDDIYQHNRCVSFLFLLFFDEQMKLMRSSNEGHQSHQPLPWPTRERTRPAPAIASAQDKHPPPLPKETPSTMACLSVLESENVESRRRRQVQRRSSRKDNRKTSGDEKTSTNILKLVSRNTHPNLNTTIWRSFGVESTSLVVALSENSER